MTGEKRKASEGTSASAAKAAKETKPKSAEDVKAAVPTTPAQVASPQQRLLPAPSLPEGHDEHVSDALSVVQDIYPYVFCKIEANFITFVP